MNIIIKSNLFESLPIYDETLAELEMPKSLISLSMFRHSKHQFPRRRRLSDGFAMLVSNLFGEWGHVLKRNMSKTSNLDKIGAHE